MSAAQSFNELLNRWHDFYILAGTMSATLMGLLFVAMSIHWDVVLHDTKAHLHAIALEAFGSFLIVAFLSLLMLTPAQGVRPFGAGLVFLGAVRMAIGLRHSRQVWGSEDEAFSRTELIYRAVLLPAMFALLVGGGVLLLLRKLEGAFGLLTLSIFLLLSMGARASWDLLVRVGRLKMRAQRIS